MTCMLCSTPSLYREAPRYLQHTQKPPRYLQHTQVPSSSERTSLSKIEIESVLLTGYAPRFFSSACRKFRVVIRTCSTAWCRSTGLAVACRIQTDSQGPRWHARLGKTAREEVDGKEMVLAFYLLCIRWLEVGGRPVQAQRLKLPGIAALRVEAVHVHAVGLRVMHKQAGPERQTVRIDRLRGAVSPCLPQTCPRRHSRTRLGGRGHRDQS